MPDDRVLDALQTVYSQNMGEGRRGTKPGAFHSTCVASKAMGVIFGTAKKATLVPVKLGLPFFAALMAAFRIIAEDVENNNRQRKAVVMFSMGGRPLPRSYNVEDRGSAEVMTIRQAIERLVSLGVPIVTSSGNHGLMTNLQGEQRTDIDTSPGVFASVYPLIVVGAVFTTGEIIPASQRGPLLTTNAVGQSVQCLDSYGNIMIISGTSFSKFPSSYPQ